MSPVTHFLAGWLIASATPLNRREKFAVVTAAVMPDIDGLGAIPELLTRNSSHPLLWFSEYHHALHTLAFAVVVTLVSFMLSWMKGFTFGPAIHKPEITRPWTTAVLAFLSFHSHLLGDLAGARGPDGYSWPIPYLAPFSNSCQLSWHGQWPLNGWQNILITAILLLATFLIAWKNGSSPLELISAAANRKFVAALRTRFPLKSSRATAA